MEFLVEFEVDLPDAVERSSVEFREEDVRLAAQSLADEGQLIRLWNVASGLAEDKVLGLYRVKDVNELDGILDSLPLHEWVNVVITRLEPHPNDPYGSRGIDDETHRGNP
jgi:muconolactone delta-isomerase